MGFYSVTTGANTLAADINQYASVFDGSTAQVIDLSGGTPGSGGTLGGSAPLNVYYTSSPSTDASLAAFDVNGDTAARLLLYIRGSDGYAGFKVGAGTGTTGHLYGYVNGWKIDEDLVVGTNFFVQSGTSFLNAVNTTGNMTVGNALTVTNGVTAASYGLSGGGSLAQANNSSATPTRIGVGPALPTSGMVKWDLFFLTPFS